MDNFNRTAMQAETEARLQREREDIKLSKSEIYSSTNHAVISMDKLVEGLNDEIKKELKQHIDNVYYHIGKIKGMGL